MPAKKRVIKTTEKVIKKTTAKKTGAKVEKKVANKKTSSVKASEKKTTKKAVAKKKTMKKIDPNSQDYFELIAKEAYFLFERRGYNHGQDQDNWYEAEKRVKKQYGI